MSVTKNSRAKSPCVVSALAETILATHAYVSTLKNKSPQPVLNRMLHQLVSLVGEAYEQEVVDRVLSDPRVAGVLPSLRDSLGQCEYALEQYWARRIGMERTDYTVYPYVNHYAALVKAETDMLDLHVDLSGKKICFIGSGPMPMTAFILKKNYPNAVVHCVDVIPEAIALSQHVAELSGVEINYVCDGAENIDYAAFDVLLMASMTLGKKAVMDKIVRTAKPGTMIGVRSVEALRRVLYHPVDIRDIPPVFSFLGQTVFDPLHVNTTLFYRLDKAGD